MQESIKTSIEFLCAVLYAPVLSFVQKEPPRVVLYYHGVDKVHVAGFKKQMVYLAKKCFVVKPSEIRSACTEEAKPIVAVTFDDAFVSVLENGLPILREYGLPAGMFVPTGYLGKRPGWATDDDCPDKHEIVMTEQQIAALDREGFEILSHTVSHPILTNLDDSELEAELVGSKQKLEQIVGHEVSGISYPHGAYDARVYEAVQKAGYKLGFTIKPNTVENNTDSLEIGRFEVSPRESLVKFKLKINGAYRIVRCLRNLKRMLVRS